MGGLPAGLSDGDRAVESLVLALVGTSKPLAPAGWAAGTASAMTQPKSDEDPSFPGTSPVLFTGRASRIDFGQADSSADGSLTDLPLPEAGPDSATTDDGASADRFPVS